MRKKKLVIYGDCNAISIRLALEQLPGVLDSYDVVHHIPMLTGPELDASLPDYADCDILLLQQIPEWGRHPMRDQVAPGALVVRYPSVTLGLLWPFSYWFLGIDPGYVHAPPEKPFELMEPGLGLLRAHYPDPEARLAAYRELRFLKAPFDIPRYAELDLGRLRKADQSTGSQIADFIIDRYRDERLFHAFNHPSDRVLRVLVLDVLERTGFRYTHCEPAVMEIGREYQVPLHPSVITELGLTWCDDESTYEIFGEHLTFDQYCLRYIRAYG